MYRFYKFNFRAKYTPMLYYNMRKLYRRTRRKSRKYKKNVRHTRRIKKIGGANPNVYVDTLETDLARMRDNYLEDVHFKNISGEESQELKAKLLTSVKINTNGDSIISKETIEQIKLAMEDYAGSEWTNCMGECWEMIYKLIEYELNSTAYMLRVISKSLILTDPSVKLNIYVEDTTNISGLWKNDSHLFTFDIDESTARLIMAFGPSASGKTVCAKKLIELMRKVEGDNFPSSFFAIDGGIYRDESYVYNAIGFVANLYNMKGLNNLVNPNFLDSKLVSGSLFNANNVKKDIIEALRYNKKKGKNQLSLYVPVTATDCLISDCGKEWSVPLELTGDRNWICSMIYQHKTDSECPYKNSVDFKCVGCFASGTKREIKGKKYSDAGWRLSYNAGNKAMNTNTKKNPPKYRFLIHNPGAPGRKFLLNDFTRYLENDTNRVYNLETDNLWYFLEGNKNLAESWSEKWDSDSDHDGDEEEDDDK